MLLFESFYVQNFCEQKLLQALVDVSDDNVTGSFLQYDGNVNRLKGWVNWIGYYNKEYRALLPTNPLLTAAGLKLIYDVL